MSDAWSRTGANAYPRPARARVSCFLSTSRDRIVNTVVYAKSPGGSSPTCAAVKAESAAHSTAITSDSNAVMQRKRRHRSAA